MKRIIAGILSFVMMLGIVSLTAAAADRQELRFGADGKFTILYLCDPQDDMAAATKLRPFIEKALDLAQPDIVIFGGDLVEDYRFGDIGSDAQPFAEGVKNKNDYAKTVENTKAACRNILGIVNDRKIPFAVALGNNDYKCIESKEWLDVFSEYAYSLVQDNSPDADARVDYNLPVLASDSDEAALNLYIFDNGKSDDLTDEQISWYDSKSAALKAQYGKNIPSLAFEHRPIAEVGYLFTECSPFDPQRILQGTKSYKLGNSATGHAQTAYTPGHTKQFEAFKRNGDVMGAYFGHIHSDGFTGVYDGIELGLTYGSQFSKTGPYGIRVLTVDEKDVQHYGNDLYVYSNGSFKRQSGDGNDLLSIWEKIAAFFARTFSNLF